MQWDLPWEFPFLYALQELHCDWLNAVMTFLTNLGNGGILNIWIITGIILLFPKKTRRMGLHVLISMLFTFIIGNLILKNAFARTRPCDIDTTIALLIPHPSEFSFPSGHSMNGMTAAVALFLNNKKIGIPAIALAVTIGFTRLYHFVHFPTDVLAGFAIGIIVAVVVDYIFKQIQKKKNIA